MNILKIVLFVFLSSCCQQVEDKIDSEKASFDVNEAVPDFGYDDDFASSPQTFKEFQQ